MYDVIIVGGGPAGSHVAVRLAGAGRRVLVLERRPHPGGKSACTGIVSREFVETFGIDDGVILRRVNSASLFSPSGKRLYLRREKTQACVLDRAAFDRLMADRAVKAGAEYRFQQTVKDVQTDSRIATVTVGSAGREYTETARVAVIAAGFCPGLLARLGLGRYRDFTLGFQAEVPSPDINEVEVYFGDVAPGFFAWLVPAAPGLVRAGLMCRPKDGDYLRKWLGKLASDGRISEPGTVIRAGGIPLRPLSRTCSERLLLVGDAAGQVKPTSGGGIYYGLIAAEIAGGVLDRALEDGDLSARRLAAYERGWRRKLGGEMRTGYWARRLFERLSARQIDRLFDVIAAGGIDEALLKAPEINFDWHGRAILSLLKYRAVAGVLNIIKPPFRTRKN